MTYSTTIKTNRPHKSFWSFILTLILVFGLFQSFLPKNALGSNSYIDNISFYKDADGIVRVRFHVLVGFDVIIGEKLVLDENTDYCRITAFGYYYGEVLPPGKSITIVVPDDLNNTFTCNRTFHYTAGQTYNNIVITNTFNAILSHSTNKLCIKVNGVANCAFGSFDYISQWGSLTLSDYFEHKNYSGGPWPMEADPEHYFFLETPTLTITFPGDNEEILTNFYITGSWTQPTSTYQWLSAFVRTAGTQELFAVFNQAINATSGPMAIFVGGMPEGYVDIDIMMRSAGNDFYFEEDWTISDIHIVNDLPWVLPGWEDYPPTTAPPVYNPLDPTVYCTEHSTYATCTPMYYAMTDTFAPVLLSVGNNLVDFASKFTPSNASSTGNQLGQSILIIRSYITNINSFFSDFPVANFLLLYLIALVVVIVLRLVKGLIGLFKI
jgi:hypothetical protein